ncbi:hypothetical protein NNL26_06960 [Micrococcus luteus]|uniref:hypothetical protein n=1 Tax=Micrococcus luteus TaxID=1270 RepID=UPI0011A6BF2A|nr:hypothetical protein [Micrococcus luteus]UTX33737.1 hypothetical protein NNL26_06960 [Micrococcus luteus]
MSRNYTRKEVQRFMDLARADRSRGGRDASGLSTGVVRLTGRTAIPRDLPPLTDANGDEADMLPHEHPDDS